MNQTIIIRTALALSLSCSAAIANADVVSFSGSMSGYGFAGPDPACSPLPFHGSLTSSSGSSSFGELTYSHDICLSGILGPSQGTFVMDFGADSFSGTLTGMASPSGTAGMADLLFNYTILSGTGR